LVLALQVFPLAAARMNGYRVKILQLHDLPGGLCKGWGCVRYYKKT
jgi:hypothetical protein